jgi:hypothetical protein
MSDILTNQDDLAPNYWKQASGSFVTSWLVTAQQASLLMFVNKIHYGAASDD